MAVAIGTGTYIQASIKAEDTFTEKKTVKFLLDVDTPTADLLAIAVGFNTYSNGAITVEYAFINIATGTKTAGVNAEQNTVRMLLEMIFESPALETASGRVIKAIAIPAPVDSIYTKPKGKLVASPPTAFTDMITALESNMARALRDLSGNVSYPSGTFVFQDAQLVSAGDIIGDG